MPSSSNPKTERIHGVLVSVKRVGVLIIGKSGIGKSECALELIQRKHKLVADDLIVVTVENGRLMGRSDPLIRGYLELHGIGIIRVQAHFGRRALYPRKQVDMVVHFIDWKEADHERGFLKPHTYQILGMKLPLIKLPVRPARNMASLVEVAASSFLLKKRGIDEAGGLEWKVSKKAGDYNGQ